MFHGKSLTSVPIQPQSSQLQGPVHSGADCADYPVGTVISRTVCARACRIASPKRPLKTCKRQHFIQTLEALTQSPERDAGKTEVFTNGDHFYEAELTAIQQAQEEHQPRSVHRLERRDARTSWRRRWPNVRAPVYK